MDKNTLSNYGWIVIAVLVLAVMIALATPFGKYIESGVRSTTAGLFETSEKAMNVVGMSAGDGNFEDSYQMPNGDNPSCLHTNKTTYKDDAKCNDCEKKFYGAEIHSGLVPEGGKYGEYYEYPVFDILCRHCGYANENNLIDNCTNCGEYLEYLQMDFGNNFVTEFPEVPEPYDIYAYGDYIYEFTSSYGGWNVVPVRDKTKTQYGEIVENINGFNIRAMESTFSHCENLITAPVIPNSVEFLLSTFFGCTSLINAPKMPDNADIMNSTFANCTSLTTASTIPSGVSDLSYAFFNCTSLTGTIAINTTSKWFNSDSCYKCFTDTTLPITLTGISSYLNELAATANNENIAVVI